jgi:hypothetical protein
MTVRMKWREFGEKGVKFELHIYFPLTKLGIPGVGPTFLSGWQVQPYSQDSMRCMVPVLSPSVKHDHYGHIRC